MTYRLKGEGYSPEETPSKNTRDMDKDKLNMNLQAMVWRICFKEQEINVERGKGQCISVMHGFCFCFCEVYELAVFA